MTVFQIAVIFLLVCIVWLLNLIVESRAPWLNLAFAAVVSGIVTAAIMGIAYALSLM